MKKLFAIIGREWRAYFLSPLAYVILAAFLLVNGYIFSIIVNYLNSPGTPKGQALRTCSRTRSSGSSRSSSSRSSRCGCSPRSARRARSRCC